MAIGLIGWGRFFDAAGNKITVPAPTTDVGKPWLYDFIRSQASNIGQSFDYIIWPPSSKAQGGSGAGCDGYGVFDRRDLGTKNQQGSVNTRYGSLESLLAAVAALNANGTQSIGDLVLHQLIGENGGPGVFKYLGADGKTQNGRGATTPSWFRGQTNWNTITQTWNDPIPPFCREDAVPNIASDNPFGREVSYQNCVPAGITTDDAIDYIKWLTKRVGFAAYRFDDTKGTYAPSVRAVMDAEPTMQFISEYDDGNPGAVNYWATSSPMNSRSGVEDFTLHYALVNACNGFTAAPLAGTQAGYWLWRPDLAVGFADNPDSDTSPGQQIIFNKGLAYAYMLTIPLKMAWVYGKDYFGSDVWPGAYGLKPLIDNLCWINRTFAFGSCETRYSDNDAIVISRDGNGGPLGWSGGLLTCINFNTSYSKTITCQTPFGAYKQIHDYSGHMKNDIWTDVNGKLTFTIPANTNSSGQSWLSLAPSGVTKTYPTQTFQTTQTFIADPTLDVLPVKNGMQILPQRVSCKANTSITVHLTLDRTGVSQDATISVDVKDPSGALVTWASTGTTSSATAKITTTVAGWYTLALVGNLLPIEGINYELSVSYTGN